MQGVEQAVARVLPLALEAQLSQQLPSVVSSQLNEAVVQGLAGPAVAHALSLPHMIMTSPSVLTLVQGARGVQRMLRAAADPVL